MDLRKFYLDNVSEHEYYYTFHDLVEKVNQTYNIFVGVQETHDYQFIIDNIDDAIEKFNTYVSQKMNHIQMRINAGFILYFII